MAQARTELIHCENCGEDYAATYRRCPYCNAKRPRRLAAGGEPDYEPAGDQEYEAREYEEYEHGSHRGGKRLSGGSGGGRKDGPDVGYWVRLALYILSALVILAAIWIMCTMVIPKFFPPAQPQPSAAPTETVTQAPAPTPVTEPTPAAADDDPLGLDSPDLPTVEPDPIATQTPVATQAPIATQTPVATATAAPSAALKLSSTDFTLSPKYPTYQMEIDGVGRSQATYSMANEAVATVNSTGLITAVGNGSTKLTVTDQSGNTATCIVRVSGMSAAAAPTSAPASSAPASAAPASTGGAKLNRSDFSITATYPDPVQLKVSGGQAASWKSSNTSVATVSDSGTVTGVGNGHAVITCTLSGGSTLTCDVYVSGK